jgi:hypothetical protein
MICRIIFDDYSGTNTVRKLRGEYIVFLKALKAMVRYPPVIIGD